MRFLFRKCSGGFDYFALSTHFGSSNDRVLGWWIDIILRGKEFSS